MRLACLSSDNFTVLLVALALVVSAGLSSLHAKPFDQFAEPSDESNRFESEVLVSGLRNPAGVVVRPTRAKRGPYELFIAESGAGRVVSVAINSLEGTKPATMKDVVVDFPMGRLGEYQVGPMALGFVTQSKLAVVASGESGEAARIAVYGLSLTGQSLAATQTDYVAEPRSNTSRQQYDADQYGLAITAKSCYVTGAKAGFPGWILKSNVEANRLSPLQSFVTFKQANGLRGFASPAVVPTPRPGYVVAGMAGSMDSPQDSRLVFCLPETGEVVMNLPTGLDDIVVLAYSPTGQLYAADFSWRDEQAGGVYRLDDARIEGQQTCRAVKVAAVVRPFGLAFAPDGSLFVTAFGTVDDELDGKLMKITGKL